MNKLLSLSNVVRPCAPTTRADAQTGSIDIEELGDNRHGYIIRAALKILEGGRPRSTDEILEAGRSL